MARNLLTLRTEREPWAPSANDKPKDYGVATMTSAVRTRQLDRRLPWWVLYLAALIASSGCGDAPITTDGDAGIIDRTTGAPFDGGVDLDPEGRNGGSDPDDGSPDPRKPGADPDDSEQPSKTSGGTRSPVSGDLLELLLSDLNSGKSVTGAREHILASLDSELGLAAPSSPQDGWSYEIVDGADTLTSAGQTGQAHAGAAAGTHFQDASTPQWLVRYACCDSLPLFLDPDVPFIASGVVDAGEMLRVHDVIPGTGIKSKLAPASSDTLLLDLLDPRDELYWAKVEAPNAGGIEGWVPLYSLLMAAPENTSDHVQVDFSYGKMAREANAVWTDMFSPEGCDDPAYLNRVPVSDMPGDCYYVNSSSGYNYAECEPHQYAHWERKADDGDTDCPEIWAPVGENGEEVWTTDCGAYFDALFYTGNEDLLFPNPEDYECGEYPIGETHWNRNDVPNSSDKKLAQFELFEEQIRVKMKRLDGQNSSDFDVKSLSHHGDVITVDPDNGVTSRRLWFGFNPQEPTAGRPAGHLEFKVCAFMPGAHVWGPEVDFDNKNTPGHTLHKIDFGNLNVGQMQGCLKGELYLDTGWQPQIVWTDLGDWDIEELNFVPPKVTYAWWVYATIVAANLFIPSVGAPIAQAVGFAITSVLNTALAISHLLPEVVDALDETVLAKGVVYAFTETYLSAYTMGWLQSATDASVNGAVPQFQPMAQAVCASVCPPGIPPGHPFQPFCSRCNAFANSAAPFEFVRDPGAEDKGCYDVDSLFTPHGKTQPSASPWWHDYQGFGWADGSYANDKGCKVGVEVSGSLEKRSWEFAKCAMWRANAMVNQDINLTGANLRNQVEDHCRVVGRDMLRLYYGTGEDLKALLEAKYPQHETFFTSNPEPADDGFPISGGVDVIIEPEQIQGFTAHGAHGPRTVRNGVTSMLSQGNSK